MPDASLATAEDWFVARGWRPFDFQREAWQAFGEGRDGLIDAPTGMGKSYAALFGPLQAAGPEPDGPRLIWITPLRSLAHDLVQTLSEALPPGWSIGARIGDTSAAEKKRQLESLPTLLVTTPESLSILLSHEKLKPALSRLTSVVVDEWHELVGSKRGVQTQLALARLRRLAPTLRTWGLSATIGNLREAMAVLHGPAASDPVLVRDRSPKRIEVETLFPDAIERFPWAGHLGLKLLPEVLLAIEGARTTLLFTGTRSQSEAWCHAIRQERPDLAPLIGLHHGSLDPVERRRAEQGLKSGELRCVVCTASLDLGVDFSPVDQVIQVGSPHGVARLVQRAGRSGHRPGAASRVLCVPTHAMELVEFAAAREAIGAGEIERRDPPLLALDVLAQHTVTIAVGGGFDERELYEEVRRTHAFADLDRDSWRWVLDFVTHGGETLRSYAKYRRVVVDEEGLHRIADAAAARRHRMSIGTIAAGPALEVRLGNARRLGTIEDSFLARLKPGGAFVYAGQLLELVAIRGNVARVRRARKPRGAIPAWHGGRSPLSSRLADAVLAQLGAAADGRYESHELEAVRPLLELQRESSALPGPERLVIESIATDDGYSTFIYPFAGRLVHEGIAALVAHRLTSSASRTITATVNDYGIEWAGAELLDYEADEWMELLSPERLVDDLLGCLNGGVLARRQFRTIARVAGLVDAGFPGDARRARQQQASSELLFEMLERYDPQNLLLEQARREVLDRQLEVRRLRRALTRMQRQQVVHTRPARLTPFSFPLWVESIREQRVSSEGFQGRVRRAVAELEARS